MKRRTGMVLVALILALPVVAAGAHRTRGIVMVWTGTYVQDEPGHNVTGKCSATRCVGDLVTCRPSERIIITRQAFSFVARVCDDTTDEESPPCAGRLTGLIEECAGPGDIMSVGPLTTVNSIGKARYCVDGGDCTGAPRAAAVIGEAATVTQTRSAAGSPTASGASTVLGQYRFFNFEGRNVDFYIADAFYSLTTLEPSDGGDCGGDGCGIAGVNVTDRR